MGLVASSVNVESWMIMWVSQSVSYRVLWHSVHLLFLRSLSPSLAVYVCGLMDGGGHTANRVLLASLCKTLVRVYNVSLRSTRSSSRHKGKNYSSATASVSGSTANPDSPVHYIFLFCTNQMFFFHPIIYWSVNLQGPRIMLPVEHS